jgi:hypothetical protein
MFERIRRWVQTTFTSRQKRLLADVLSRLAAAQRELQACREENKALRERIEDLLEQGEEPEPPVTGFDALSCAGNTAEQNKALAIPAIRASREPRIGVESIPDITPTTWSQGDLVRENLESKVGKGYSQWNHNVHRNNVDGGEERPGSYLWKNVGCSPELDPLATQLKWGTREFNVALRMFVDCDFTDITQEHGLYVSNYADTEVTNCTFLRCGSQGVQWAHRELPYGQYGADTLPYQSKPRHVLRDSHFVDNAYKGTRPSFNATYFDPGSSEFPGTLLIENCSFVCDWPEPKAVWGGEQRSTGGLVVAHMQGNPDLRDQNMMEKVHVRNCLFDFTKGDRSLASIRSTDEVIFEDCCFIARDHVQPFVTIDPYLDSIGNTKTKKIRLKNCASVGGVKILLHLPSDKKYFDIQTLGEEVVIDGVTGEIISREAL